MSDPNSRLRGPIGILTSYPWECVVVLGIGMLVVPHLRSALMPPGDYQVPSWLIWMIMLMDLSRRVGWIVLAIGTVGLLRKHFHPSRRTGTDGTGRSGDT